MYKMNLDSVKIRNFRGYQDETVVVLNDLTAFVGKNDAGKSTVLEALEIFFNSVTVKIEKSDLNVDALEEGYNVIEITCVFSNTPISLVIDAAAPTTLKDEYLLNFENKLEIKKTYNCALANPKEQVFIRAFHPSVKNGSDLLALKRQDLKKRADQLGVDESYYNGNVNSSIRSAIWKHLGELDLVESEIQVDKEDTKKIWEYIEKWLPQFALFKSDRESSDGDKEVTDPMKVAITMALGELQTELGEIQKRVMEKAIDVAQRTLGKLSEMNPSLANELRPDFKSDPRWASLFGLTLFSDRNIPVNKRGSGVRRLIVLNFFRAEAERRRQDKNSKSIIYAFEEPENSQHPDHQRMLVEAFKELSELKNTQVLLTTHNPSLAGLINLEDLRLVTCDQNRKVTILDDAEGILPIIANTLGMLPDPIQPRLLICVEGTNDVSFLKIVSSTICRERPDLPDLSTDGRVAIIPLGGGTLKEWVNQNYLKGLNIPEFHIYDLDDPKTRPYENAGNMVKARGGSNWAVLTSKRETENYLHPDAIAAVYRFEIVYGDMDDVPLLVAKTQHSSASQIAWDSIDEKKKKDKISRAKKRLNNEVAQQMTWAHLQESDKNGDIIKWLEEIRSRIVTA